MINRNEDMIKIEMLVEFYYFIQQTFYGLFINISSRETQSDAFILFYIKILQYSYKLV